MRLTAGKFPNEYLYFLTEEHSNGENGRYLFILSLMFPIL